MSEEFDEALHWKKVREISAQVIYNFWLIVLQSHQRNQLLETPA